MLLDRMQSKILPVRQRRLVPRESWALASARQVSLVGKLQSVRSLCVPVMQPCVPLLSCPQGIFLAPTDAAWGRLEALPSFTPSVAKILVLYHSACAQFLVKSRLLRIKESARYMNESHMNWHVQIMDGGKVGKEA
jgi:hypothetical protein